MNRKELYESMYNREYDRKEKLNAKLSIILTIFSVLTALLSYNINQYIKISEWKNAHRIVILHVLIVSVLLYIVAFYFAVRAFIGYPYQYLPSADNLDEAFNESNQYFQKYYQENEEYFEENKITVEELCDEDLDKMMENLYKEIATHNFMQNNIKT